MADVQLRSITFPGLDNRYVINTDATLTTQNMPADAKAVGDRISNLNRDTLLFSEYIPGTVQTIAYSGYTITLTHTDIITHSTVRTDVITEDASSVIETRTLNDGSVLTITTDADTLETTIVYTAA